MDKLSFGDLVGISEHLSNEELKTIRPALDITSDEYRNLQRNRCKMMEEKIKELTGYDLEKLLDIYECNDEELKGNLKFHISGELKERNLVFGSLDPRIDKFLRKQFILNVECSIVANSIHDMIHIIVNGKDKTKPIDFTLRDFESLFGNKSFIDYVNKTQERLSFDKFFANAYDGPIQITKPIGFE